MPKHGELWNEYLILRERAINKNGSITFNCWRYRKTA